MLVGELFSLHKLYKHIREGYISKQRDGSAACPLLIYNYTHKCQWEKAWDEVTTQCRGLVVNENTGMIVARPFKKFFNLGEMEKIPEGPYRVFDKMDGSLGIGVRPGMIATRGSFESDQAKEANKLYSQYGCQWPDDITPLWEIIHPVSKVVVNYDEEKLVLLATIDKETGLDTYEYDWWTGPVVPEQPVLPIEELAAFANKSGDFENKEGFVILWRDGTRAKVKYGEYVRLHRLVTGITAKRIWEVLSRGESMDEIRDRVPDEFFQWTTNVESVLRMGYAKLDSEIKQAFAGLPEFKDRKDFALYVRAKHPEIASFMFCMLDKKDYSSGVWKLLKPAGDASFKEDKE